MYPRIRNVSILALILVIFAALANVRPVQATLAVDAVTPSVVVNDVATQITISGSDFIDTAIVRLNGITLTSTYVSATTLTAVIPQAFATGTHDLEVEIPGVGTALKTGAVNVLAPTAPPTATATATPTATPFPFSRPQVVIDHYTFSVSAIKYGEDFVLYVSLDNAGGSTAYGMQVTFTSVDLLMLKNGGVIAVDNLSTVGKANISQSMTAAASLYGRSMVSVDMNVTYADEKGTPFSEKFTIYVPVASTGGGGGAVVAATATPTGTRLSRLVITQYTTDLDPLQPGMIFALSLSVKNMGTIGARNVTMIVGGGSSSGGGTPQAGVSAGSGEFTNFAPLGTSNVQSIGNVDGGMEIDANQKLVVNVGTNPGAYPMRISFLYTDTNGNVVNDEQVITLLVYRLPQVQIGFYQPVGELYMEQAGMLPIQVVNLGRNTVILGNMSVESDAGYIENGQMMVGALDMGGYFPLDATFYPSESGSVELLVTITYLDDFNQPRTITQVLEVDVLEMTIEPPIDPGFPIEPEQAESFWHKLWRFILGLLGLDSSAPSSPVESPTEIPFEPLPSEPLPSGGKG